MKCTAFMAPFSSANESFFCLDSLETLSGETSEQTERKNNEQRIEFVCWISRSCDRVILERMRCAVARYCTFDFGHRLCWTPGDPVDRTDTEWNLILAVELNSMLTSEQWYRILARQASINRSENCDHFRETISRFAVFLFDFCTRE